MEETRTADQENRVPAVDRGDFSLGSYIAMFLSLCWVSLLPPAAFGYLVIVVFDPVSILVVQGSWARFLLVALIGACGTYLVLLGSALLVSLVALRFVTGGKPIPDEIYENSPSNPRWRNFSYRHLVKKFPMWVYENLAPRWLHRKFVGCYVKIGKNVRLPKWMALEGAEVGDNTVIARQNVVTSHFINGDKVVYGNVKIGKNCIIDAEDETRFVCIAPGAEVGDDVILKPGSFVGRNQKVESGGIYQGSVVLERIGNTSDLSPEELESYRRRVMKKTKRHSRMVAEWSSFTSKTPRLVRFLAELFGWVVGVSMFASFFVFVVPWIGSWAFPFGHVLNVLLIPVAFIISYGFYIFIPVPVYFLAIKRYSRMVPRLRQDQEVLEITDPGIIEKWKCMKWLKWQAIDRVNRSLWLDTSMLVYQRLGENDVAFKTVLYVSKIDPDYVSIGDNTIITFESHVYAYRLEEKPEPRLVIKRTSIGSNCIIGSSQIHAGAKIGDNCTLGFFTVVPEDTVLEPGRTYAGRPVMEFHEFLEHRRKLREKEGKPVAEE